MNNPNPLIPVPKGPKIGKPSKMGLTILIIFVGGFLLWATLFKLESAAVAPGKIIFGTNRKTIEHLEGGIVRKIFVHEGSKVKAGDILIQLDTTQAKATLDLAQGQTDVLLAREAYLTALRDDKETVTFPERLLKKQDDPKVKDIINNSNELFKARKKTVEDGIKIYKNRIEQLENEIDSLEAKVKANETQIMLIGDELASWAELEKKSYIDKPRVLALKRESAKLEGDKDESKALIARAEQRKSETELQIVNLIDTQNNEVLKLIDETKYELISNLEKERNAQDILDRTTIRSPIAGTVLNLKVHTLSGVISPAEALMDIVPEQEQLIIEARISPNDIDVVYPGLLAKVRLTAYKQRTTPTLEGKVINISGDVIYDERANISYYNARVVVDANELKRLKYINLYPGMPVQVYIITDYRTPLNYFLKPITDSFRNAFKED